MKIRNVIHKGLRRFIEDDDASGLQPAVVTKVQRIVSFLQDMEHEEELRTVPSWKAHILTGNRKGTWSLFRSEEHTSELQLLMRLSYAVFSLKNKKQACT